MCVLATAASRTHNKRSEKTVKAQQQNGPKEINLQIDKFFGLGWV